MSEFDRQKWDSKYTALDDIPREPSRILISLDDVLPGQGKAIDVAGGAGRNAIWLAQRGLDVTIADISTVGLALAREKAWEAGVSIATLQTDLEEGSFPAGPWDLVLSNCYLCRHLFPAFPTALSPGGVLVVIQPTKRNLERHSKPPFDFLLDDGELPSLVQGLEIIRYEEGWLVDDRHDAVIVARQRGSGVFGE